MLLISSYLVKRRLMATTCLLGVLHYGPKGGHYRPVLTAQVNIGALQYFLSTVNAFAVKLKLIIHFQLLPLKFSTEIYI